MLPALNRTLSRLWRAEMVVLLPVPAFLSFWAWGEWGLLAFSLGLPVAIWGLGRLQPRQPVVAMSEQVIARLDAVLAGRSASGQQTGCLVLQFDDASHLCDRLGRTRQSEVLAASIARLRGALRPGDMLFALEDGSLAVALGPTPHLDLEIMVRIAARLQLVVQQPLILGGNAVQLSCSIGFCHGRQLEGPSGRALLEAAQIAVDEASCHRPGALRAFTEVLAQARAERNMLRGEFAAAVEAGQVRPHFQPQLSTDTGRVSGIEALVRWHHPTRGCLAPGAFLPALEGTDLMELLGQTMLSQSLAAIAAWDNAGLQVPTVAVNFSAQELRDPELPERLSWALDQQGLLPSRLTVEVLESVVAQDGDDVIVRNLDRISRMGCGIDMDDFGTGNASITSILRFSLRRLKIDRSFVRGVDTDREQQKLVMAILSLAERLDLDTLAEGVETQGEHAMLAQLGCGHVQGYVIARPMPFEDVGNWLAQHQDRLAAALKIDVRAR